MSEQLRRAASGFVACFSHVTLDRPKYQRAVEAFAAHKSLVPAMSALAGGILLEPPVDDMLIPFLHAMLVHAATGQGVPNHAAEQLAADVVLDCTRALPLAGLRIAIGAPRGDVPIAELSWHDVIITPLHEYVLGSGGFPTGPQEHAHDVTGEAPSDQWHGHVRLRDCSVTASHDALVLLSGRSVGVGEALGFARILRIPVIRVDVPLAGEAQHGGAIPCRLTADGETVLDVIEANPADQSTDIALEIVHRLIALAPTIRQRQRIRMLKASELHAYRGYLADAATSAGLSGPLLAAVQDPIRFLGLGELERDELARRAHAMPRATFAQHAALPRPIRAAYDATIRNHRAGPTRIDPEALLRAATQEMVLAGSDTRSQRPQDWTDPMTWERVASTLPVI